MGDNTRKNDTAPSRRDMMKKAGKFVVPTLVTFKLTELHAKASSGKIAGNPYGQ